MRNPADLLRTSEPSIRMSSSNPGMDSSKQLSEKLGGGKDPEDSLLDW